MGTGQNAQAYLPGLGVAPTPRPVSVSYSNSGPGFAHTKETVAKMCKLARDASHTYEVRHLATEITRGVPSKDPRGELFAIYAWVRNNIRYRYDPLGLEWVQSPMRTVAEGAGDCDDMAVLIAALAGALGHPWRYRTVGRSPDVQEHVQTQAWDRKAWLDLDPVLEPKQATTAPRADRGMFGAQAVGAERLWNPEGKMLAGPRGAGRRRRRMPPVYVAAHTRSWPSLDGLGSPVPLSLVPLMSGGLAGPVAPREAELWQWSAYYAPTEPARSYGMQPAQPGAYQQPDFRYRSPNAPGYTDGVSNAIVFQLPAGTIPESQLNGLGEYGALVELGNLGWGWVKKVGRAIKKGAKKVGKGALKAVQKTGQFAHKVTHGKNSPIAKIHKGIQNIARETVILKPFVDLQDKVFSRYTEKGLEKVGMIKKGTAKKAPSAKEALKAVGQAAQDYGSAQGGGGAPGGFKLTPAQAAGAAKAQGAAKLIAAGKAKAKAVVPKKATAIVAAVKSKKPKFRKPANAKLRAKYPKNARMLWDKGIGRFRIYVPKTAQLNGARPTFTVSFGAPLAPSARPNVVAAAVKAINAVNTFAKNHAGKPPAVHIPAVHAFQAAELGLTVDGLYGTNTRTALLYYVPGAKLPEPAPKMRGKVTWRPQEAPAPKPVAPKPTVKPGTPVAVVTPVAKPAAPKPTTGVKTPSGYTEIAQSADNPGLPPVGYETKTGTAKPAQPVAVVKPKPKKPKTTQPALVLVPPVPPPGPMVVDGRDPLTRTPYGPQNGSPIVVTGGQLVDVSDGGLPDAGVTDVVVPLPNVDTRPLPSWPTVTTGEPVAYSAPKDDETLLWLAVGYLWWRQRNRAA